MRTATQVAEACEASWRDLEERYEALKQTVAWLRLERDLEAAEAVERVLGRLWEEIQRASQQG